MDERELPPEPYLLPCPFCGSVEDETYPGEDLDQLKKMTKAQLIREIFVLQIHLNREQYWRISAQTEVNALLELVKEVDKLEPDTLTSIKRQTSGPLCVPIVLSEGQKVVVTNIFAARANCRALGLEVNDA